ncbi:MAG: aldolase catalytic domain-containing protein [Candidatus Gastranaerophilales bacterium]|nr:aldolase catalytic domain-containing protein [Candidatus Gastranaerophilales bacterium]
MNIEVLDCTLRDGGYVNNWKFGYQNIQYIINSLVTAKIDYIECGFLKDIVFDSDYSIFDDFKNVPVYNTNLKYALMVNYGDVDLEKIFKFDSSKFILRIAFKKEKSIEAIEYCEKLIKKGFSVFVNPMNTISYSYLELLDLIKKINSIKPDTLTIVDTLGQMDKSDTLSLFYLFDKNLDKSISLGYHSHNNLAFSFSNVLAILEQNTNRNIIIDSSLFGMGRGAGNLQTEVLTQYLNDNCSKHYDLVQILKTIQECINPIFAKTPWGISVPYRIAALNSCHPDYAKFLIDRNVSVDKIDKILKLVPMNSKDVFQSELIVELYERAIKSLY